jgi:hypothetical protein
MYEAHLHLLCTYTFQCTANIHLCPFGHARMSAAISICISLTHLYSQKASDSYAPCSIPVCIKMHLCLMPPPLNVSAPKNAHSNIYIYCIKILQKFHILYTCLFFLNIGNNFSVYTVQCMYFTCTCC